MKNTSAATGASAEIIITQAAETAVKISAISELLLLLAESVVSNVSATKKVQKELGRLPDQYMDLFIKDTRNVADKFVTVLYDIIDKADSIVAIAEE